MNLEAVTRVLSPKQIRSVAQANARLNFWTGSIRSGKTIASLLRWLIFVAQAPTTGELVMCGKTRDSIGRNIFGPLQDPALFGGLTRYISYNLGAPTAKILGRTIQVIGANDEKAEPKVRGMTCCGAYVDEATVLPKTFFKQLTGRLSVPGAKLFATTNPDNPGHWLRQEYLLRASELDLRSWHFVLDDNPHLDPDYVRSIKAEYVGLWYRRFILGHWVQAEGAIYEAWNPDRHVVDALPRIDRWFAAGIDYGTTNPFAALLLGYGQDEQDVTRLYLTHEYRYDSKLKRRALTDPEYSEQLRTWLSTADRPHERERGIRPEWIYVDPSAASFSLQLYRDGVTNAAHADNEVIPGIRTVSGLIARDQLRVHRSCKGLIDELPGYSWDDAAAEKGEDKPIKIADHSLDALRYAVHTSEYAWRPHLMEAA